VQFGADLASVLDDGNKLRVLPIVGRGSVQSVADILFLQGVAKRETLFKQFQAWEAERSARAQVPQPAQR
jgi:hypothetical protein